MRHPGLLISFCIAISVTLAWPALVTAGDKPILKIGYSDWPGWVAWDVAVQNGWFEEAGVDARFFWYDYVKSMDAYAAGKVDAVCMTNFDALVTGESGKPGKGIVINDYSNGNDMVVARKGIESVVDLKGKKVGLEVGLLEQLLLRKALEQNGLTEADVTVVNIPTDKTPLALKAGKVDAIVAWQPSSGQAMSQVPGAKAIFTSADVPGLIYDMLFVSEESLQQHPDEWKKVAQVWFRVVAYLQDPANRADALKTMAKRAKMSPQEYEPLLEGAFLLDLAGNKQAYQPGDDLTSVYGSTKLSDTFNVEGGAYQDSQDIDAYLFPDLVMSLE